LEVLPAAHHFNTLKFNGSAVVPQRQEWFGCACCPPNIARITASLGHYMYAEGDGEAVIQLYGESSARLHIGSQLVQLRQTTNYPWDETISIEVTPEFAADFTVSMRIPGWCRTAQLKVNGQLIDHATMMDKGYVRLTRTWSPGDHIELQLSMPVEVIEAHPEVRANAGRIALQRGPIVYCLEETDNSTNLRDIALALGELPTVHHEATLLGGVTVLEGSASRTRLQDWAGQLYRRIDTMHNKEEQSRDRVGFRAVPYFAWGNRTAGEMLVWLGVDR
jgi:DUF1680 family protein